MKVVKFLSCNKKVVSGGEDEIVKVWDIKSGECFHNLKGHNSTIVSIEIVESKILSGNEKGTLIVWDSLSFKKV